MLILAPLIMAMGLAAFHPAAAENASPRLGDFSPFDPPLPTPKEGFEDAVGGKVALGDFKGQVVTGRASSTDVIEASVLAYVNAINRLSQKEAASVSRSVKGKKS